MLAAPREIQRRIQCARRYPTESQIRRAAADFETWRDLYYAGFPTYLADLDEPPADHRTEAEKSHDTAVRLLDMIGEQGSLFPLDRFEPTESTLKEMVEYADQQDEITARFVEHGRKRRDYVGRLIDAVGQDLSQTWQAAHMAAFGTE